MKKETEDLVKECSNVVLHLSDGDYLCYFHSNWVGLTKFYNLSIKKLRTVNFLGFKFKVKTPIFNGGFDKSVIFYIKDKVYIKAIDFKNECISKLSDLKDLEEVEQKIEERIKQIRIVKNI